MMAPTNFMEFASSYKGFIATSFWYRYGKHATPPSERAVASGNDRRARNSDSFISDDEFHNIPLNIVNICRNLTYLMMDFTTFL